MIDRTPNQNRFSLSLIRKFPAKSQSFPNFLLHVSPLPCLKRILKHCPVVVMGFGISAHVQPARSLCSSPFFLVSALRLYTILFTGLPRYFPQDNKKKKITIIYRNDIVYYSHVRTPK